MPIDTVMSVAEGAVRIQTNRIYTPWGLLGRE